jgi:hypothetical protein
VINNMTMTGIIRFFGAATLALVLAACATQGAQSDSAQAVDVAPSVEPWEGDGMEIPLDGGSLEAFENSLARVKAHTSPENYTTLVNAIDYLMVYDLTAKRDRAKLASNLDGLTPNEVIAKVIWRNNSSGHRPATDDTPEPTVDI